MKVAVIAKSFTKGGAARGATNLANALTTAGAHVTCFDGAKACKGSYKFILRTAERVLERAFFDSETHCLRLGPATFSLEELARSYCPDIIQLCDISGNTVDLSHLDRMACPVVHRMSDFWPYHGHRHYALSPDSSGLAGSLMRLTILNRSAFPDRIVAPSEWLAKGLIDGGLSPESVRVIPGAAILPETLSNTKPLSGQVRLGFISNDIHHPRKGFAGLRAPLTSLAQHGFDISLLLHGKIKQKDLTAIPGVEVIPCGPFSRSEISRVYDSFDILLCPSSVDNSPNVVIESLSHGRPVIAQLGTGMDSYISTDTGRLIDFGGDSRSVAADLTVATEEILSDYECFSRQASEYVRSKLSPKVVGNAYLQLYRELLTKGS